mgnify:CR=1 FL=1
MAASPRDSQWKQVRDAMNRGLPKTAIEKLDPIIELATQDKAYAEAIKAVALKISLEGNIQGNKPEEKITRMREQVDAAPVEMKPVMEAVLANWYWHYFQQNRWRFVQRTETSELPSEDFTTWDLPRILAEVDAQFEKALEAEDVLKSTPIAQYDELFEKGSAPDAYRPTLYDVLAQNALEFYASGEQAGAKSQDAFEVSADGPIFSSVDAFLTWDVGTTGDDDGQSQSPIRKAAVLYQRLLQFHRDDEDQSAFLDADLSRLEFGNNFAVGEEKTSRYKASLGRFEQQNDSHVISARALHLLGAAIHEEGDWVRARDVLRTGLNRFPDSVGGRRCYNLIQSIEAQEMSIQTERVWNDPPPTIDVTYRNVTKVYFRLVSLDFEAFIRSERWNPEQLDREQRQALLGRQPSKAWTVDLPATADFQQRIERVDAPIDVAPGAYYLIASHKPDFTEADNQVSLSEVWVSDLALVLRNHQGQGVVSGFVLDAKSGEPISGASVRSWYQSNRNQRVVMQTLQSDRNGMFRLSTDQHRQLRIHVRHGEQALSSGNPINAYRSGNSHRSQQTRFFTDRTLYRPGQTIQYKGICLSVDQDTDNYQTIANRDVTVVFSDVNNKEIERQTHRTNDYGSFSGSVTAPRDRLTGQMYLRVDGNPHGQTAISVEEYKRPKFTVSLDPPSTAAKLHGDVQVDGAATAYTGAAIGDAKVQWRVVRQVRYPRWWYWRCWWMPQQPESSQEIAHGFATTKPDGSFAISFVAKPDDSVSRESEPTFQFTVYADVTDTTGETRSDQLSVRVGYTALKASMSAEDWLTDNEPTELSVATTTLDGQGQTANGSVKIHSLIQPEQVSRKSLGGNGYRLPYRSGVDNEPAQPDPSNPDSWELGDVVAEYAFTTDASGHTTLDAVLNAGFYRAVLQTQDSFGHPVTALLPLRVLDPESNKLNLRVPDLFASETTTVEPGERYIGVWGSGYETARAYIEVEHRGKILQSYWTDPSVTQKQIQQEVDETMRGGFTVRTTMVRENRAYLNTTRVEVPWSNKELTVKWEHFVSKLKPAQQETWTAVINGPDAQRHAAEMVATLYDASLDAYQPFQWMPGFGVFRQDHSTLYSQFENQTKSLQQIYHTWRTDQRDGSLSYRHFPGEIIQNVWGYGFMHRNARGMMMAEGAMMKSSAMFADGDPAPMADALAASPVMREAEQADQQNESDQVEGPPKPDLENVSARKNLDETAFFFPHLIAGDDGTVKLQFTMPEALTEWKFMGFAHDEQLRSGLLTSTTVTAKDLMVQPNPPRFVREGDVIEFTVKVSNQSPTRQTGSVRLTFADARSGASVDGRLGNSATDQSFEIPTGESKTLSWRISVPDQVGYLTYKAVGSTGRLSDGEEGFLPVLSRRILVTESLPLPIRGSQQKQYQFTKLIESKSSDTIDHQSLTVQMVSNPSWYAVMALPYLMEYPHQCSEQTFNRLYANSLAKHIAASDPKIERIFQQWRGTPALDSPLEKNEDLKAVMLDETPWLRQAADESQARRNVAILFDANRLNDETRRTSAKLAEMQLPDGLWPWFPGGRGNEFITLYITTGFGRMRHLGVDVDMTSALMSLSRLDAWVAEQYDRIKPEHREKNHLSTMIAFYLYGRSFFLKDQPIAAEHREAVRYWQSQAKEYWLDLAHRQSQAHLAVALKRFGDTATATAIMASIKERAVTDDEMGMFWRDLEFSWWWYRAPIETQAMMIEAFDEVMDDAKAVEDCKVWLLKQKQTQDWKTTKATADAVYSLLLRGSDLLASDTLVEVELAGQPIKPVDVEAGTGFYQQRFVGDEIKPELGNVIVTKRDEGVAWGSMHWQYLEDIGKVTPHEQTPLRLTKQLHVKKNTSDGPKLFPVQGPLEIGDELVVRVVLRTDRDMEYVHLKDHRGSGTEPVNVLSRYKYQDGLAYYESTRDTASHFFIDYLPKGTYVFEYATRIQLRGEYQTGLANIQCMYAPEFNSHSESLPIVVK